MASSGIMVNSRTALTFPCTLTLSRINAEFKDGVLSHDAAENEEARPKQINVEVN